MLTIGGTGEAPSLATTTQIWFGRDELATVLGRQEKQKGNEYTQSTDDGSYMDKRGERQSLSFGGREKILLEDSIAWCVFSHT